MENLKDLQRVLKATFDNGGEPVFVRSFSGEECLGKLFTFELTVLCADHELDLEPLLGQGMSLALLQTNGDTRYFHGFIDTCGQLGSEDEYAIYRFTLRPWLWFLSKTSDCRIYQELKVPDIIWEVFGEAGFSDIDDQLTGTYDNWNYCVQYNETDFDFLSRLMELEGIYYFYRHEDGKDILVLADSMSTHDTSSGYETIQYFPEAGDQVREEEHFNQWSLTKTYRTGRFAVEDYNFVDPKSNMLATIGPLDESTNSEFEQYHYTANYPKSDNGTRSLSYGQARVKHRAEADRVRRSLAYGAGDVQGVTAGHLFKLSGCNRKDQDREYLIVCSTFSLSLGSFMAGDAQQAQGFYNRIEALPSDIYFRTWSDTPKPRIQGPQTAIVVGPAGEEIWTDQHGRVKLQFHWDRYGSHDENSSCWVRVSQVWAGQGYGAMHIPRIGHEVIVDFINGDPDQPIVTGRVYNGDNPVPYDLPANATQSGIKSRSSQGGSTSHFNEIRMEDKKGSEELYIHAERNHTQVTEANRSESVGNDRSLTVGNDKTEHVKHDTRITIDNDHVETIGANSSTTVKGPHHEHIVSDGKSYNYVKDEALKEFDNTLTVSSTNAMTLESSDVMSLLAFANTLINSEKEIVLKSGNSSITLEKSGVITIKGKQVVINGTNSLESKSAGEHKISGKTIKVTATGKVEISGSSVEAN